MHRQVLEAALGLRARGLTAGKSGNVSMRFQDGFLVTPSGVAYDALATGHMVFVAADGTWQSDYEPSSEWQLHREIYRSRGDVGAIVHAHPRHSTALSCTRRDIPAFHYMVVIGGGKTIRCADYATFGTIELAQHAVAALADRKACLLANHGSIALAATPMDALDLIEEVEALAAQYVTALALGDVTILDDAEMDRVLERFKAYGQASRFP